MAQVEILIRGGGLDDSWLSEVQPLLQRAQTDIGSVYARVHEIHIHHPDANVNQVIVETTYERDDLAEVSGFVVSPTVSRVLRKSPGGLSRPLRAVVLDPAPVFVADSAMGAVERGTTFGQRVESTHQRIGMTSWKRVRYPGNPSSADLDQAALLIAGWVSELVPPRNGTSDNGALPAAMTPVSEPIVQQAVFALYELRAALDAHEFTITEAQLRSIRELVDAIETYVYVDEPRTAVLRPMLESLSAPVTVLSGAHLFATAAGPHAARAIHAITDVIQALG